MRKEKYIRRQKKQWEDFLGFPIEERSEKPEQFPVPKAGEVANNSVT